MANKLVSIKSATDGELDALIIRLRKENELQNLIANMKRQSADGYVPYDQQQGVSAEAPIESLYHVGVLGMRWGKTKGQSSTRITHIITRESEDHTKKVILSKKNVKEMSNAELKAFNERMNLEKQYRDLTKKEVSGGRKVVQEILGNAAKQTASQYATKYLSKGVEELLKKGVKK